MLQYVLHNRVTSYQKKA